MVEYRMDQGTRPQNMATHDLLKDALRALRLAWPECSWKKVQKRPALGQLAYRIQKSFGHRSDARDLYVHHPRMADLPGYDPVIPMPGLRSARGYFRLVLLGRRTMEALLAGDVLKATTQTPNEVYVDVDDRIGQVVVTMELSLTAFALCAGRSYKDIWDAAAAKWGGTGAIYNVYSHNGNEDGEGFRVIRRANGVPVLETTQGGWIPGQDRTGRVGPWQLVF